MDKRYVFADERGNLILPNAQPGGLYEITRESNDVFRILPCAIVPMVGAPRVVSAKESPAAAPVAAAAQPAAPPAATAAPQEPEEVPLEGAPAPKKPQPERNLQLFSEVADLYEATADKGFETSRRIGAKIRAIVPEGWRKDVQYQLYAEVAETAAEGRIDLLILVPREIAYRFTAQMKQWERELAGDFPGAELKWTPSKSRERATFRVQYGPKTPAKAIAEGLKRLMQKTHPTLSAKLQSL
jgi:hypothetical protein